MKPFNEHGPKMGKTIKPNEYALHGDVIIFGEDNLPKNFNKMPKVEDACLAYGEMTGHAHKLVGEKASFDLRECPKTKVRYLKVVAPIMLKHQEHSPIEINPGQYRIGIQQEYDPFEKLVRQVAD